MTPVVWTATAVADLEAIHAYVARDSVRYADALVDRIVRAVDRIGRLPRSGNVVPELNNESIRELVHGNYRIVYRLGERRIEVIAVVHGARLLRFE